MISIVVAAARQRIIGWNSISIIALGRSASILTLIEMKVKTCYNKKYPRYTRDKS